MYCRRVSCASATSDSSPTATAPRCCRCAISCWTAHSKMQLPPHQLPQISLIHSGIAQSAAQRCASSNRSPLHNSCFALHRNQTGAPHEALYTSRPITVCQHARRCFVSSGQNPSHAELSSFHFGPPQGTAPLRPALMSHDPTQLTLFKIPLHPIRPIQTA